MRRKKITLYSQLYLYILQGFKVENCLQHSRRNRKLPYKLYRSLREFNVISNTKWSTAGFHSKASLLCSDASLWQDTRSNSLRELKLWTCTVLLLVQLNSRITSTILRQRIMRNIELIREGTQPLVVCEFSLWNGMGWRWRKTCVYDIYLLQRVGINEERMKSEGEPNRLLPP
jgi:hypothetical protein